MITFLHGVFSSQPASAEDNLERLTAQPGIVCVLDLPEGDAQQLIATTKAGAAKVYFQSNDADQVKAVREAAEKAGLLGTRVFAGLGSFKRIHLADNVADGMVVAETARSEERRVGEECRSRGSADH